MPVVKQIDIRAIFEKQVKRVISVEDMIPGIAPIAYTLPGKDQPK